MSCHCCHTTACTQANGASPKSGLIREYGRLLISSLLLAGGIVLDISGSPLLHPDGIRLAWYLAAYFPVGIPVLREAWEEMSRKDYFNEFTLMSIATAGTFCIGEYPEGVAVMLFYSLGERLQDKAVAQARRSIRSLMDVRPQTATVVRDGKSFAEAPQLVRPGETLEVKTGERVPLDGRLLTEAAMFNTSALTGESLPRRIRQGEEVLAGMIATDRAIRVEASRPFEDSSLSRILQLVEEAAERKAPAELFIRRFARIYTPIVTGLAALIVALPFAWSLMSPTFAFHPDEWAYRALVFLVISCPCALVVSIPLSYFSGIGAASRAGILFKGGNYLDAIGRINTVVFDKTGTLTKGNFEVQSVRPAGWISEEQLIRLAASAEQNSTHPIAKAVVRLARQRATGLLPADNVVETAAHGLQADINGERIRVGNLRLMEQSGIACPPEAHGMAGTTLFCAVGERYAGCMELSDTLKEDARPCIEALKKLKIDNIRILSGDKQAIVTTFARQLGVSQAYGDLLPEGKVRHVEALKQDRRNRIAFVGDGINDTPVLAMSHVGIAMGGLGSDAAIETADVVIQTDQPSKVATAIRAGRQTRRIVRQNVTLAFGVKLLVLLLGAGGMATLWEAVFADVGVTLLAVANAGRIRTLMKD